MGASIKITVLVENSVAFPFLPGNLQGMLGEHGLSVLVDNGEEKILFDTGRGSTLPGNLEKSGNSPENIDKVAISHGHLDHTGSLLPFLQTRAGKTTVCCDPDIFEKKYGLNGSHMKYIGIPFSPDELEKAGAVFNFTKETQVLGDGVFLSGRVPRVHQWEQDEGKFFIKKGGSFVPDNFEDDQAIYLNSGAGLVIITGCGHAGIINTMEHALKFFGNVKVMAVVGGLHLSGATPERVRLTIRRLKEIQVEKLFLGHCTGFEAMCQMRAEFGERIEPLNAGKQIDF
ncbi:MAG: MBL fold metallo-hydrolase [Desulfocucumaceae bacterium]